MFHTRPNVRCGSFGEVKLASFKSNVSITSWISVHDYLVCFRGLVSSSVIQCFFIGFWKYLRRSNSVVYCYVDLQEIANLHRKLSKIDSIPDDIFLASSDRDSASGLGSVRLRRRKQSEVTSQGLATAESVRIEREKEIRMKHKLIEEEKSAEGSVSDFKFCFLIQLLGCFDREP
jgi:hypothetical protein